MMQVYHYLVFHDIIICCRDDGSRGGVENIIFKIRKYLGVFIPHIFGFIIYLNLIKFL